MTCPNELTLSIFVDGELGPAEAAALERHAAECGSCAERLDGLRAEVRLLRAALELPALTTDGPAPSPLQRPLTAALAAGATAAGLRLLWALLDGTLSRLPDWLNPLAPEGSLNLLLNSLFYLLNPGGGTMDWSKTWTLSTLALVAGALAVSWAALRRPRALAGAFALLMALALAAPAAAIEVRTGQQVVAVRAGETVEGSLVMAGETVRMEGSVEGDLVAFAREVSVRGPVGGGVYVFGQKVDLEGSAGGTLHGFAQWLRVAGSAAGNGYFFAQGVSLLPGSRIEGDAAFFGETATVEGEVGRDLTVCGRRAELRGGVGGDLQTWTEEVDVADGAAVGGDLIAHMESDEKLMVAAGTVAGEVRFEETEQPARRNRYASPGFYLWSLVGLVGAFVVGAVLWWLAPWLLEARPAGAGAILGRLGLGLVVLVATPICLLIVGLTMVGLPLAVLGLVFWGVGIYLAKIATAGLVGRGLLGWPAGEPKRALAALALGLLLVGVASALPWIGGWIAFLAVLLGLGLLSHGLWTRLRAPA